MFARVADDSVGTVIGVTSDRRWINILLDDGRTGWIGALGAAVLDRGPLRVQLAELRVESLADDLAVADDHRADEGIGAHASPAALGEGERALQELAIGG